MFLSSPPALTYFQYLTALSAPLTLVPAQGPVLRLVRGHHHSSGPSGHLAGDPRSVPCVPVLSLGESGENQAFSVYSLSDTSPAFCCHRSGMGLTFVHFGKFPQVILTNMLLLLPIPPPHPQFRAAALRLALIWNSHQCL